MRRKKDEAEVPFPIQQELMGHAPTTMTMRYTHLPLEKLRGGINRLPGLLDRQVP